MGRSRVSVVDPPRAEEMKDWTNDVRKSAEEEAESLRLSVLREMRDGNDYPLERILQAYARVSKNSRSNKNS